MENVYVIMIMINIIMIELLKRIGLYLNELE